MSAGTLGSIDAIVLQLEAFLKQIASIQQSEFPYDHAKVALDHIELEFSAHLKAVRALDDKSDPLVVASACSSAFDAILSTLPLLGFVLRSTNVRNAFEVTGPLLRVAKAVLGPDAKLILSSEWELSPFTYVGYRILPGFVLIGFPATESDNPFLLPLAGHELGHSVWRKFGLVAKVRANVHQHIVDAIGSDWQSHKDLFPDVDQSDLETNLLARQSWEPAATWALRQSEECFCDLIGLWIFGEAYLHSNAYFLTARSSGTRSVEYPNGKDRAAAILKGAASFGYEEPQDYLSLFSDLKEPTEKQQAYWVRLADRARENVLDDLIRIAENTMKASGVNKRDSSTVAECLSAFRQLVPPQGANELSDLVNAAWQAMLADDLWGNQNHDEHKSVYLKEMVLKAIEVFEIEKRLSAP